jgi:NACHT domain
LPYAIGAPFNAYQRQHDLTCLSNTRVDLLREIYSWADRESSPSIFWLSGLAGTGKSTVARTVATKYSADKALGASFFFTRGSGDLGHAGKFVTSIAVQLADYVSGLKRIICNAIAERSNITNQSLRDQWLHLILGPLSKLASNSSQSRYILVLDALDECEDKNNIQIILQLLGEVQSLKIVQLRVFLTSRPEVPIRNGFIQMFDVERQDFVLHNISSSIVDHDIRVFLEHNLKLIAQAQHFLRSDWPGEPVLQRLIQSASGLFIWAATACRFIREGKRFATRRLNMILEQSTKTINEPEKHLNKIYITVLRNCISPEYSDEEAEEQRFTLKSLLGSIVTLLSPLSIQSLSKLLSTPQDEVDQISDDLHAILNITEDPSHPLYIHHPSFRDFLLEKTRCEEFWVDEKQAHQVLAESCIQILSISLKQDICGVDNPGLLAAEIERSRVEQMLSPEVQYACLYWSQHVERSGTQLCDNGQVHCFLQKHFLYWLEALGWMRKVSEGIHAITSLELFASVSIRLYDIYSR